LSRLAGPAGVASVSSSVEESPSHQQVGGKRGWDQPEVEPSTRNPDPTSRIPEPETRNPDPESLKIGSRIPRCPADINSTNSLVPATLRRANSTRTRNPNPESRIPGPGSRTPGAAQKAFAVKCEERLVFYCRTTSASTAPRTPRRTCCPYAHVKCEEQPLNATPGGGLGVLARI